METLILFFDGSCEPTNPNGNVGIGVAAYIATDFKFARGENKRDVKSDYTRIRKEYIYSETFKFGTKGFEETSCNMAEHLALGHALQYIIERSRTHKDEDIYIFGDSEIIIKQMTGEYRLKKKNIYYQAGMKNIELTINPILRSKNIHFEWIPRELNAVADALSNKN